jgi:hypothetical protein
MFKVVKVEKEGSDNKRKGENNEKKQPYFNWCPKN